MKYDLLSSFFAIPSMEVMPMIIKEAPSDKTFLFFYLTDLAASNISMKASIRLWVSTSL